MDSKFLLAAEQTCCEKSCKRDIRVTQCHAWLQNALQRCGNRCEK